MNEQEESDEWDPMTDPDYEPILPKDVFSLMPIFCFPGRGVLM